MNAIQNLLDNALPEKLAEPRPLSVSEDSATAFPVEALPLLLQNAALAIQAKTQAPLAMCGQSVLAVASLVAQGQVNVTTLGGGIKPCSLFFITIAESGERKSSVDSLALKPIKIYESRLRGAYELQRPEYDIALKAYEAQTQQITKDKNTSKDQKEDALRQLASPPSPPLQPIVTCEEPTFEALCKLFLSAQPSLGLFSDEGGMFLGGYALKEDNQRATITGLSKCWDGDPFKRIRAVDGNHIIAGKRLALHLMVQPVLAEGFLSNRLNQQQGLLARMLVAFPPSTMGTRYYQQASAETEQLLRVYEQHLLRLLEQPKPQDMNHPNELKPRTLLLSLEATNRLITFHDELESQLGKTGALEHLSGFANKLPEHAARLAGVLAFIDDSHVTELPTSMLEAGILLARYYLNEALRWHDHQQEPEALRLARKLHHWLEDRWEGTLVSKACIQAIAPKELREKGKLDAAFATLVEYGWLLPLEAPANIHGHTRKEAFRRWGGKQRA
ncbi:MAG: YfjI family protein [Vampirovibrionales bacterium]